MDGFQEVILDAFDDDEFVASIIGEFQDQGLEPIDICRAFFGLGFSLGHEDGHACAEQEESRVEVGMAGYL